MTQQVARKQGLRSLFWYQGQHAKLYYLGVILLSAVIIAAAAQIQIPLHPVPVTLQTFAVILLAMTMGWRLGLSATMLYLVSGLMGAPVFAGFAAGPAYLVGPTGGYLMAFPLAALLTGWLAERGLAKHVLTALLTATLGLALIVICGTLYLSAFIGSEHAYLLGMQPFFLDEICKAVMIAIMVPKVWRFAK